MWLCDGWQIKILDDSNLLRRARPYKTYSVYYCHGKGFQVLRDNATSTRREEGWLPLSFEHDKTDYSSYLTNARYEPALHCHRTDQTWMSMLLPDVYHDRWEVPAPYGGLKGELAIFLALIAFAIPVDDLQRYLPAMFQSGVWQQYDMLNGSMYPAVSHREWKALPLTTHRRRPQARCCCRGLDILPSRWGFHFRPTRRARRERQILHLARAGRCRRYFHMPRRLRQACSTSHASLTLPCWLPHTFILSHLTQRTIYGPRTLFNIFPCVPPMPASRHCNSRQIDTVITRRDFSLQLPGVSPRDMTSMASISLLPFPQRVSSRLHPYQNVLTFPHPHPARCIYS